MKNVKNINNIIKNDLKELNLIGKVKISAEAFLIFLLFFAHINRSYCQNPSYDIKLIEQVNYSFVVGDNNFRDTISVNNKEPLKFRHKSIIAKYNPLSLLASSSMLFYQYIISPQFFRHCLYERSCSNFSKKSILEFGLIKGVFMSADRLLRCNMEALNDIPPCDFDVYGYAIDEPKKYHIKKK